MRILDPEAPFPDLKTMFHNKDDFSAWQEFARHPRGIIPATGPTGSVKAATPCSAPLQTATSEINVTAVGDPIKMVHDQINQIAVQPKGGFAVEGVISTILRQDPEIVMAGGVARQGDCRKRRAAGITGRLVASTLHAFSTPLQRWPAWQSLAWSLSWPPPPPPPPPSPASWRSGRRAASAPTALTSSSWPPGLPWSWAS
ncbi:MAG: Flp pilus assembly complex ATPase component TadA, partial [Deltaproteobacteria bacterium]|jgi:type II secretory ATPase GspE/PulE/Tfp pilus assembly ATPase PilB-like protein|nr:Flp pilus assembly complex ATPase component TadA [Deltaproteobacteria bacterium]